MSENDELASLKGEVRSLNRRIDCLRNRADDAHGEARACRWLLTQVLRSIGDRDRALLDDCLNISFPSDAAFQTLSPVDTRVRNKGTGG